MFTFLYILSELIKFIKDMQKLLILTS